MAGYFTALSSPSLTLRTTIRRCSPRSKPAVQTRLPTFSISSRPIRGEVEAVGGRGDHAGVEVACPVGVDLHDGQAEGLDPLGVDRAGDVAFDDRGGDVRGERGEDRFQERRLAAARRSDDVDAEDAGGVEAGAVFGGELIVGFENAFRGDDFHARSPLFTMRLGTVPFSSDENGTVPFRAPNRVAGTASAKQWHTICPHQREQPHYKFTCILTVPRGQMESGVSLPAIRRRNTLPGNGLRRQFLSRRRCRAASEML